MGERIEAQIAMTPGEPHPALTRALLRLLRPLVQVLIAKGVTFPVLTRLLKTVYVEVANSEFRVPDKPQTDSRISLLTGVHRKDVKVLRERRRSAEPPPLALSRNAHLIATWTGAADYLDDRGQPRPLPRQKQPDGRVSFESLVASVSKDIRARAVLDEWLRLGLVRVDDANLVHLNTQAFVPSEDFADLAFYFGRNLADHIAASGHNLLGGEPPMLEQAVYYEELSPESIAELSALTRQLGSDALVAVNRKAFVLAERDRTNPDANQRMAFGVYFFTGPDEADGGDG